MSAVYFIMESDEFYQWMHYANLLRLREESPEPWTDRHCDMTSEEKSKLIDLLLDQTALLGKQMEISNANYASEKVRDAQTLSKLGEELSRLNEKFSRLNEELSAFRSNEASLLKEITMLKEQLRLSKKNLFGSKSQKGSKKKIEFKSRGEDRDDFDGTPGSLGSGQDEPVDISSDSQSNVATKEISRPYRLGLTYRKMEADRKEWHHSDPEKLPAGAVILKKFYRCSYRQVCQVVEHNYQIICYKTPDGIIHEGYFPLCGEPEIMDVFPRTHASCDLLAYLAFNKYRMETPLYRELIRLLDEKMSVSRMTLTNWLNKGALHLNRLLPALKSLALEKSSIVNCDETWCRVRVNGSYKKKYIWCMVNKQAKIAIFFYDNGSRGRDVLKEFLGNNELDALQSDGYNVYLYLDDKLIGTEHLCCMAHGRAKFKYAFEQGGDRDAEYFPEQMGELYKMEADYRNANLSSEQIWKARQGPDTFDIMVKMRCKLDELLQQEHVPRSDLMHKALTYLDKFREQLFAYRKDGRYDIDNSIAERAIRPLTIERKNSLAFGGHTGVETSAIYHTIIETCKMNGISVLEYFKKFFREILAGRQDYENLLPMTIGVK